MRSSPLHAIAAAEQGVVGMRLKGLMETSVDWAACDPCGGYIAAGERLNFPTHCAAAHHCADGRRELRRAMRKAQRALHACFWRHYRGGATRGRVRHPRALTCRSHSLLER
jgi:hypothetical protein